MDSNLEGGKLNIRKCASCDGAHDDVDVSKFIKSLDPWTHWFSCPTTKDPVPLSLDMHNGAVNDMNAEVMRCLSAKEQSGQYLVAICRMENNAVHLNRITNDFPTGEFQAVIQLLTKNLMEESGPPVPQQLAEAQRPKPAVQLFGNSGDQILPGN